VDRTLGALGDGVGWLIFAFILLASGTVSHWVLVYFSILALRFMRFIQGHTMVEMAHFSRSNRMAPWVTFVPVSFGRGVFGLFSFIYSRLSYFWVFASVHFPDRSY